MTPFQALWETPQGVQDRRTGLVWQIGLVGEIPGHNDLRRLFLTRHDGTTNVMTTMVVPWPMTEGPAPGSRESADA